MLHTLPELLASGALYKADFKSKKRNTTVVRMRTAPMCFWDSITPDEWNNMSNDRQDEIIESAKNAIKFKKHFTDPIKTNPVVTTNL